MAVTHTREPKTPVGLQAPRPELSSSDPAGSYRTASSVYIGSLRKLVLILANRYNSHRIDELISKSKGK